MRVSIRLFGFDLDEYGELAVAAENVGMHGVFVPDHVLSMIDFDPVYPYRSTGRPSFDENTPVGDPLIMLAHLGALTRRIRLGVGVYVLPMRHPLHAARQVLSVQVLTGGRLDLGVGVGWAREEFEALGSAFESRGARAEEMIAVMRGAWTGRPVSFDGRFHRHRALQMSPAIGGPVPILWGGASDASVRRAVRMADGLYAPPGELKATLQLRERVRDALAEAGREEADFRLVVRAPDPGDVEAILQLREHGFGDVSVNLPRDLSTQQDRVGWLTELSAGLSRAGALS